jgi:hypothetical protein
VIPSELAEQVAATAAAVPHFRTIYAQTAWTAGLMGPPKTDRERELVGMLMETLNAAGSVLDLLDAITATLRP